MMMIEVDDIISCSIWCSDSSVYSPDMDDDVLLLKQNFSAMSPVYKQAFS